MARQRFNRLNKPKKSTKAVVQQLGQKLPFLLLILAIAVIGYNLHRSHLFEPEISWTIDEKLSKSEIHYEQLITSLFDNKYLISLAELKTNLEAEPWIASAEVNRFFWNKIDIELTAHTIAMRWQDKGYISTEGALFKPEVLITSETPLAVVDEIIANIGKDRTALRISPGAYFNMLGEAKDREVFDYLLKELEQRNLAFLHVGIFDDAMEFDYLDGQASSYIRSNYNNTLVGVGSYSPNTASIAIENNKFDLVAIGRPFIANADYVAKVRSGLELVEYSDDMLTSLV